MASFPALSGSLWITFGTIAAAALIAAAGFFTRWAKPVFWFALFLMGQACSLQLLVAGNVIRLQTFHGWGTVTGTRRILFLLLILVQAVVLVVALRRSRIGNYLRQLFRWPGAVLFLGLVAFSANTIDPAITRAFLTGDPARGLVSRYFTGLGLSLLIYGTSVLNLLVLARSLPADVLADLHEMWQRWHGRRLASVCALWVVAAAAILHWVALDGMPHVPDEVAYVFQAKYIAQGQLFLPTPPVPEAFPCTYCLMDGEKWYSAMLGGWAFLLAAGYWAGIPWLVNPLLGGVAILLAYALAKRLVGESLAKATVLLMAFSPWLLFMSASLMPHPSSLVFALLGLLSLARIRGQGHWGWAVLVGLAFGALLHVRPLEAVGLAAVGGVWWLGAGWQRIRWPALGLTIVAGLFMTGLFLEYNKALTGDPMLAPVNKMFDQTVYPGSNRLGFGPDVGNFGWIAMDPLPGHGPVDVVVNSNHNLYMVGFELFGWAAGSLLLVYFLGVRGQVRANGLMLGLILGIWAITSLYWFSGGPDFGARYWYLMLFPLVVLTVRGADALAAALGGDAATARRVGATLVVASVAGCLTVIPWRVVDKYRDYRGISGDVRRLNAQVGFGRSLVLIQGESGQEFASAFALNPPLISPAADGPIYALDRNAETRKKLLCAFRDRPVWVVAAPTVSGDGFRVTAGPVEPHSRATLSEGELSCP